MKKYYVGCIATAVMTCLVTSFFLQPRTDGTLSAQEDPASREFGFQASSAVTSRRDLSSTVSKYFNQDGLTAEEAVSVAVYDGNNRGVAHLTTRSTRPDGFFFLDVPAEGTGSGSVIDREGHILTNLHVIEDARAVAVTLHDGKTYDATFVGADPINDIAIIKIDAKKEVLFPIVLGDSNRLRVGMRVYAIGNPFGLERTLTTGIISSLNRSLQIHRNRTIKSIIQIDAAINPGNSGGPLLGSHGKLIGMNTAIASKTGQSSGVGFAIPVNLIARVIPQLIEHGRIFRPELGIEKVSETDKGLRIAQITPNGAAEAAGLRGPMVVRKRRGPFEIVRIDRSAADLVIAVDGKKVETFDDMLRYVEIKRPGDRVVITVIRDDRRLDIAVKLAGPRPNSG